jgi:glutamate formiminotransferase
MQVTNKNLGVFEVLTAVKMSILVFWVVTPCELVGVTIQKSNIDKNLYFLRVNDFD